MRQWRRTSEGERLDGFVEFMYSGSWAFASYNDAASSIHPSVPPVFDGVVAATWETSRNLGPPLPHLLDQSLNQLTFFRRDGSVVESGLEVLMKALPTLLWSPGLKQLCDPHPVVSTVGVDQAQ